MERNGIERSHGEALDCQTIGYISVHGSTYSKYDAHIHSHMTQTHTHTQQGKIFMFDGAFYVLRDFRFVLLLMMLRLNWITDQDCRGQREERGGGGDRWLRVAISGIWINKFKTCISPFDLHSHLSRRIALLFCRIHFHFRFRPLPASFATCHSPLCSCAIIETSRINWACYVPPPVRSTLFSIYLQYIIAFNAHTQCSPKVRSLTRTA